MRLRTIALTIATCFAALTLCFASPQMGTWKLNESKSKIPAGAPKNTTVMYAAAGDSIKATVDGVDGDGKATHNEWTGKFDGKDYPLVGDPASDTRSYKMISAHKLELTNKKAGKVTATGTIVVSEDGKSRTVTVSGMDAAGKKVQTTTVYDKQ
ncbi:MAG: hypothetical protein WBV46_21925 [Terriglobales bacterium]